MIQGPQYRSVIFYHNEEQKEKAEKYKQDLIKAAAFDKPIVTAIEPLTNFYAAENYHRDYYKNHSSQPYCYFVIKPKMDKLKKVFADKLKTIKPVYEIFIYTLYFCFLHAVCFAQKFSTSIDGTAYRSTK